MRAPLSWLGEYVQLPESVTAAQVAADLVRVGLEEEALHGGDVIGPVVVGQVLEFVDEPQKNGKTIRWCQVDVGEYGVPVADGPEGGLAPRGIVCGAHNFIVGDQVVVSLPGAVLAGGFAIAARKTYGHVSDGMICSAKELGLGDDHTGIIRLVEWGMGDVPVGTDAIALLGLAEETVEVNVTPDRGYALSLRGLAREYGHATGAAFTDPALIDVPAPTADGFEVRLQDGAPVRGRIGCDRYVARIVHNVDAAGPSPRWLQRRLEQAGMRPISLAVDVTNYVMLAVGQPLHAFDLDQLTGPIVVRRAKPKERLTTLDGVDRALSPEDLLITDSAGGEASDHVLALAGVMGGASSEVSAQTTNLLIEAAHFDSITTARTSRRHKLSTEASRRYERGVDTELADRAAELAVRLLIEHGGGQIGPVTYAGEPSPGALIRMSWDLPNRVTGCGWTREQVIESLVEIGCEVSAEGAEVVETEPVEGFVGAGVSESHVLCVQAPSWRPDLRIGVDLVEEVARLRGYEQIPSILPVAPPGRGRTHGQDVRRSVARGLAEHGLTQVLTYPFVGAGIHDAFGLPADDNRRVALKLANPLSDEQPYLRTSVLSTVIEALRRNVSRGFTDLGLFEIGLVTRPVPAAPPAGRPGVESRPTDDELAALDAAIPPQPRRAAIVMTGLRELPGWDGPGRPADWSDALAAAMSIAETVGVTATVTKDADHAPWHPGRCARLEIEGQLFGHAGELHPKVVAALGLPLRTVAAEVDLDVLIAASGGIVAAEPISTFPLAKEDVALVVDAAVPAAEVQAALVAGAGELLESVRLFDVYTKPPIVPGQRSLAFALRFRAPDRTLTADETLAARDAAVAEATARTGAVLRS
jgi:phenylalanyl-tRNA synthetase beta chain